jgi:hypothetical protein
MSVPESDRTYKLLFIAGGGSQDGDLTVTLVQPLADLDDLNTRSELAKIVAQQCPQLERIAVYDVQKVPVPR